MVTAGRYVLSGDWLYEIGMPGRSRVSGGIVPVSPGKVGLATFSPRWMPPETACAANSSRSTWPSGSGSAASPLNQREPDRLTDVVEAWLPYADGGVMNLLSAEAVEREGEP